MLKLFNKFIVFTCLVGWVSVLFYTTKILIANNFQIQANDSQIFALPIWLVKIFQTLQIFDIFFILVKISKGSIFGAFIQILARLIITWLYLNVQISPILTATVLIAWSLADSLRYLYYFIKNPLTTWLRYNQFIILYPIGATGQILLMNNFVQKNQGKINQSFVLFVRFFQVLVFAGFVYLYRHMLGNRSKAFHNLQENKINKQQIKEKRGVSPKKD